MLTITRDLNVYSSGMPPIISLSQYDSDFQLVFNLYTSDGTLNIPSGTTAQIQGTKRDGNGYSASATISGNTVTVTGHNQMTACAGANIYEISLINSGKVLNTINFILAVEPAAMDAGTIQSETVLKELQAIIDSAATSTQAAQDAEDAADRAEEAARSLTVDPTLTQSGQPADAKVTGDEIAGLKEDLGNLEKTEPVDFSVEAKYISTISPSSGKWSTSNNPKCYFVAVPEGAESVTVVGNESNGSRFAFLQNDNHALNTTPTYATGYTAPIVLDANTEETYALPEDCAFIWIAKTAGSAQTNKLPESTVFKTKTPVSESLSALQADVDSLENVVAENTVNIEKILDTIPEKTANLDAEIVGFICYGQSWSMGYDTNAITGTQRYDNIMLDTGLMNNPASALEVTATAFSPLIEQSVYSTQQANQRCGETPCTAQTDIVKQLLITENGIAPSDIAYQIFSAAPGMGSKSIEQLSKGTDFYTRMMDVIRTANGIARAQGKGFVIPAISWTQGKSTNNDATYYDLLEGLREDIDADVKAITGQSLTVKLIAWQAITDSTTARRFYERTVYASEKYENIICSGTFYNFEHVGDANLHLTANSQDWLGAQLGIAYKRSIIDGVKFVPLKPRKAETLGNIAYIDFDVPVKPLVFDTTLVADISNKGFQVFDSTNTEKTITSVEIIAPDRIKIVCASDFADTDHIVYGGNGTDAYNPTTGKRGNLRDSQSIVYRNHNNVDLPCYNWCVVFDKTISELT